jgi:DNA ligase-1
MLEAVADASGIAGSDLRRALAVSGDIGAVGAAAMNEGAAGVGRFRLQIFRPLLPMLAQSAESTDAAIVQLGESAWEYKLDGVRIQVHKSGEEVRVFTRHLKDISAAVPDIVEFARALPVRAAILDGEALALKESGRPHPFQVTMRRFGRRQAVDAMRWQLPLTPVLFDCLHLDGQDFLDAPAVDRWAALASAVPAASQIPRRITNAPDGASAFLNEARAQGHEGLVAKAPDQPYMAGARGGGWLKIKPFHSLDLVILAAECGSGRRRGSLSNLHLGARDPATGTFVMLGKTFKGLTDDMLSWQTSRLLELETGRDGQVVYVRPECVVEVAFDGVQASPTYPSGAALRFARVKRHRDDKQADQADEIGAVLDILRSQHSEQDCCAATVT